MEFPAHKAPPNCVTATIDGAARGNPGPAAYGVVFADAGGKVLTHLSGRLGRATNNVAEYRALLVALTYARTEGWRALRVRTDSELLAKQLLGDYKVKSADLKPLYDEAQRLIASFIYFAIEAVPRQRTRAADKLANAALDKRPSSALRASEGRPAPGVQRPVKTKFSPAASAAGKPATGRSPWPEQGRVVRAVYEGGVLKPLGPLDLTDGDEVEVFLRRKPAGR